VSDTIIRVENLSKKYILGQQKEDSSSYKSLRESMSNVAKSLGEKILKPSNKKDFNPGSQEFWALKDVSFEIKQGDRVGFIGRNGAGKSTLLKILSRITQPTSGSIRIKGRVASLLEVGTGFHPELTGRENIFLNGAILGMGKIEIQRKFDEIVAFAEVEKFLDTPVKRYSSGMYVRLAFAVAAHLEPEILIVDEVLAVGDMAFQKKCLGKMEEVGKEGRTVLFVSHSMPTINQLCQKVIWLDRGQIVCQGKTNEIVPNYLVQGSSDKPTVYFERRNSKDIFFTQVTILDSADNPSTEIDARLSFSIKLTYEVKRLLKNVEMAIRIKTDDDKSVFTSVYSDCSDISKMNKSPGIYTATITIPGLFLVPNTYTISCAIFEFENTIYTPYCVDDNIIRFNVCETGTKIAKYNDHRAIGVVLVEFPWREEMLSLV
jgi:lipopolysaccharide transport system ATP-binding protein